MTDVTNENAKGLALLREPFPANQISYLPKGGAKLAYVGHAALTDRLLDADPAWTWEPLAMSDNGLPVMDELGGMWIKLTVCGITRLGYGHAGAKTGGDAIKEVIGDALRNAAMRFGAALDLWHKGDLHAHEAEETQETPPEPAKLTPAQVADWLAAIGAAAADELQGVVKRAYAAAEKARDREAYAAFRAAKQARAVTA
jgi:hypothetical protein